MTPKTALFTLSSALLLFLIGPLRTQTVAPINGFGKRVAGTYVQLGQIPPGPPFEGTFTIEEDGSFTSTNTNCCGMPSGFQGIGQGIWKKTGNRQITITGIIYTYLADGTPSFVVRPTLVMDYDAVFETATGSITSEIYNPLLSGLGDADLDGVPDYVDYDPEVQSIVCAPGTIAFRRLHLGLSSFGCP